MKKINFIFHVVTLLHHVYVLRYPAHGLDFTKTSDPRVLEMRDFGYKYFTTWNLILQIVYLCLAVVSHVLIFWGAKSAASEIQSWKGYWFTTFIFPFSVMVSLVFWSLYHVNRDFVLPEVCDEVLPGWLNHSVHTNILFLPAIEMMTAKQRLPSFKSAFYGISVLVLVYDALFFYTYYQHKRWLYGVFYVLNWYERVALLTFNYVAAVGMMRFGLFLQTTMTMTH